MSEYYKQSLTAVSKDEPVLQHFGIRGMKWGVRRFQNADGSLTDAGKRRYSSLDKGLSKRNREYNKRASNVYGTGVALGNKSKSDKFLLP